MSLKLVICACLVVSTVRPEGIDEGDPKYIESKDYNYYLEKSKSNVAKDCAINEMAAYGLTADATSLSEPNDICPQMTGNCCGVKSQERIRTYWEADDRHQSSYYNGYLKMNRYIIGHAKNFQHIAADIMERSKRLRMMGQAHVQAPGSQQNKGQHVDDGKPYHFEYHPMCDEAATKLMNLDFFDRYKAKGFYEMLNRKTEFMQNSRRGFYCMLCDVNAKNYIKTHRWVIKSHIWYSKSFCQMLYTQTFESIYFMYKSYAPYLKNLMKMMACIRPKTSGTPKIGGGNDNHGGNDLINVNVNVNIQVNAPLLAAGADFASSDPFSRLSSEARAFFNNPLGLSSKAWLEICYNSDPTSVFFSFKCMGFCAAFDIVRRSRTLDGDIDSIKMVYEQLVQYEYAFTATDSNLFDDDVLKLKSDIHAQLKILRGNYNFYRTLSERFNFQNYATLFIPGFNGVDPMALSQGTSLHFKYKFGGRLVAGLFVLTAFLSK